MLQSTRPVARIGHESGFSPDGKTFYAAGTAFEAITAVDVTDPKQPHAIWQGNVTSHGMTLSPDGKRAYIADPGGEMLILDVSEIQARKASPQAREVSRLTWKSASIPQNALPFTRDGKPYVLEFDEYTQGTTGVGDTNAVGAGRIIDIADERAPRVVANLRLQINQPAEHAAASSDPGALSPVQGYAAHYCSLSSEVDPTVVACSFITSGLRVFDISDLLHPKEIAYYVAPTQPRAENGFMASDFAMSKPVIVPSRREVWYTDGATGFNVLHVAEGVWPGASGAGGAAARAPRRAAACRATRRSAGRASGASASGMTRKALARKLPAPRRKTKRSWRWCVKGGPGARLRHVREGARGARRHHRRAQARGRPPAAAPAACAVATATAPPSAARSSAPARARPASSGSAAARSATWPSPGRARSRTPSCSAATCAPPACAELRPTRPRPRRRGWRASARRTSPRPGGVSTQSTKRPG